MTTDLDAAAAAMFPSMAPSKPPAAPDPAPNAAVAEVRAADAGARAMFKDVDVWGGPADGSGGLVRDLVTGIRQAFPDTARGDLDRQVSGLASALVDIGADHDLVRDMSRIVKTHAGAQFDPDVRAEMRAGAVAEVQRRYGPDAARKLADAQKLVNRDPRLATILSKTGLGDSPKVVVRLVEIAASQRAAGKLR